jgi:hypothetical protein
MMRFIAQFALLSFGIYLSYNWLLIQKVPQVYQVVGTIGIYGSMGAAAALMVLTSLLGKSR